MEQTNLTPIWHSRAAIGSRVLVKTHGADEKPNGRQLSSCFFSLVQTLGIVCACPVLVL